MTNSNTLTASPFEWEADTFLTGKAPRIASLICASHIPHIMPSILRVVFVIFISPIQIIPRP